MLLPIFILGFVVVVRGGVGVVGVVGVQFNSIFNFFKKKILFFFLIS